MKNIICLGYLLIIITACVDTKTNHKENNNNTPKASATENNTSPEPIKKSNILKTYKSLLRPNQSLELGKIYTDTVTYISENRWDYDEALFFIKKGQQEIALIDQREKYPYFFKDEKLLIQWKIDSLRPAGDPEFLDFTEFILSAKRADSIPLISKNVKVLWREDIYSPKYNDTINSIILNFDYLQSMSLPERAALG